MRSPTSLLQRIAISVSAAAFVWVLPSTIEAASKRKRQDYGTPEQATTPGQVLLWGPRVVLFPLYVVSEYAVRRPVGLIVRGVERDPLGEEASILSFGPRRQTTIRPFLLFDYGVKPSVGFNLISKHFLLERSDARLHFDTWGPDWIRLKGVDTYALSAAESLELEANWVRSQDEPFYGMGPRSPSDLRFRFQTQTAELAAGYERRFWRGSRFEARVGFRARGFGDGTCCGEAALGDGVRAREIAPPPGFADGYAAGFQRLSIAFDSRKPKSVSATGVHAELFGDGMFAPAEQAQSRRAWVTYGGSLGAMADVYDARVVAFEVDAQLADPLVGVIPFIDRVSLGGDKPMRGYLRNRLIDQSSLVARMQYTWPVWPFLDGVIQTDVGNVFGQHFEGFELGLLRLSTGIGVRSNDDRDSGFELLVAGATDPFESGFRYSSFRFVIGSRGF